MNWGLSDELAKKFPKIIPVSRPLVLDQTIKDPNWLLGLICGEGNFFVNINKSKSTKIGEQVLLVFKITQHIHDTQLMKQLIVYLECGNYYASEGYDYGDFSVSKFSEIVDIIILFLDKHKIIGVKSQDFQAFKKVAELMKTGEHLTSKGIEKIRNIKAGMNSKRKI